MKRITPVILCLIGLLILGLHASADPSPPDPGTFFSASGYDDGSPTAQVQPPAPRTRQPFFPRLPSFELRPLAGGPAAVPLSLAADDLDEDGIPDLICGYAQGAESLVVPYRGNADFLFPSGVTAGVDPFLGPAGAVEIAIRPDHLFTGDFDNDGARDVVVGSAEGTSLLLLAGDGSGTLREAARLALPGRMTAMTAGDVNRRDGMADLVVAVVGPEGPAVLVFQGVNGAFHAQPEVLPLPAPAVDLAHGPLHGYAAIDLVIGTERELLIVKGRDRKIYLGPEHESDVGPAEIERVDFAGSLRSVAVGDLMLDPEGFEIATLFENGKLQFLGLDEANGGWEIVDERYVATPPAAPRSLRVTRLSGSLSEDVVVLDTTGQKLVAVNGRAEIGVVDLEAPPVAVLPMRLDPDARMDLVVLEEDTTPRVALSGTRAVITVDTALDSNVPGDGSCSLREAIGNANADTDTTAGDCTAGSGADTIAFGVGGGGSVVTITPGSALPDITDSVTIDGNSQGCATGPCVELVGTLAGIDVDGLRVTGGSSTLRGLVVRQFDDHGITLDSAGNFVEGNFIGTDQTGRVAAGNLEAGILSLQASNTIGGTAPGAGNLVSANNHGIRITGTAGAANVVQGNLVGTDATGTADLGNVNHGIIPKWSAGNIIGGTSAAARNVISGNGGSGVRINQPESTGNLVQGNFAGTDITGTLALGNDRAGVGVIYGARDNTIGGSAAGARNVLSANFWGIAIYSDSTDNVVAGNFVGTELTGTAALPNGNGVQLENVFGNTVGGVYPQASNLVSGNDLYGVVVWGNTAPAGDAQIFGNLIGTDVTGTLALGNLDAGVYITEASGNSIGGTSPGLGNLISANDHGITVYSSSATVGSNEIVGNLIGTDITGLLPLGNVWDGIEISQSPLNVIGGTAPGARNVISANTRGVIIAVSGVGGVTARFNEVLGNYIGTDITGTVDLGNVFHGVVIKGPYNTVGGTTPEARNVISGNDGVGVWIRESEAVDNEVLGNYIGVDVTGAVALGNTGFAGVRMADAASYNTIGGTTPGARNIISGNTRGVLFDMVTSSGNTGNQVVGNYIGTDFTGTVDLGNALAGVLIEEGTDNTIGGAAAGEANVISGNGTNGVAIVALSGTPSANIVQGNLIGTDVTGTIMLGNDDDGVIIEDSTQNLVGGSNAGEGNLIAGNGECGVEVYESTPGSTWGNGILGNSIVSNVGMGIDHGDDGITANDSQDVDVGPNQLQNFPVLTSADADPAGITLVGTLNSRPGRTFRLEFFTSTECDDSGCGEGERYLGFTGVMTNMAGDASFNVPLSARVSDGDSITATATDAVNNTSEFADCYTATCLSFAAMGQTLSAADKNTLFWPSATDVRFVKGNLAGVSIYTVTGDGTLMGATSLDISGDSPYAGAGMFYLVRPLGCGSWQNVLGSEPGRDPVLP